MKMYIADALRSSMGIFSTILKNLRGQDGSPSRPLNMQIVSCCQSGSPAVSHYTVVCFSVQRNMPLPSFPGHVDAYVAFTFRLQVKHIKIILRWAVSVIMSHSDIRICCDETDQVIDEGNPLASCIQWMFKKETVGEALGAYVGQWTVSLHDLPLCPSRLVSLQYGEVSSISSLSTRNDYPH